MRAPESSHGAQEQSGGGKPAAGVRLHETATLMRVEDPDYPAQTPAAGFSSYETVVRGVSSMPQPAGVM